METFSKLDLSIARKAIVGNHINKDVNINKLLVDIAGKGGTKNKNRNFHAI